MVQKILLKSDASCLSVKSLRNTAHNEFPVPQHRVYWRPILKSAAALGCNYTSLKEVIAKTEETLLPGQQRRDGTYLTSTKEEICWKNGTLGWQGILVSFLEC